MANWREENSVKEINSKMETWANNGYQNINYMQLEIRISGADRLWKTIYDKAYNGATNISEGFKTWREVAIFLSGMRKALKI